MAIEKQRHQGLGSSSQNVDIATVSARLGHASINTTIKYYVHPLQKNMRKAAYVLQDLLINNNDN